MRKRLVPTIIVPLLVALGLMSLPTTLNNDIQKSLAQKALAFSRIFKSQAKGKAALHEPIQAWLQSSKEAAFHASVMAEALTPFTIQREAPEVEYCVAQVLFRTPSRWNSSLWVNKGSLDSPHIQKNSPVLSKDSVIGIVDYVTNHACCIRLITDPTISPSVRVARKAYDRSLVYALDVLQEAADDDLLAFKNGDEKMAFLWMLHHLKQENKEPTFLAKGILQGQGDALWKTETTLLKGTGFNYDFKDQYGPARDLRTGEAIDPDQEYTVRKDEPLVQTGDLLVTSGMDGIFPEGLKVAKVHSIKPLTEGAYTYELLAMPTADNLQDLDFVIILPPQPINSGNLPKPIDFILDQLKD